MKKAQVNQYKRRENEKQTIIDEMSNVRQTYDDLVEFKSTKNKSLQDKLKEAQSQIESLEADLEVKFEHEE
jgi:Zn-dependent oligopeptidase